MHEKSGWIVWNFEHKPLNFLNENITLSARFPQFANVYHVSSTKKGNQHFLKCDCLLYERCGIPCSHILKITDQVEATMIKIQHWKVFHVHFGLEESKISSQLMQGISIQLIDKDMGVPISEDSLIGNQSRNISVCQFIYINYLIRYCVYSFI